MVDFDGIKLRVLSYCDANGIAYELLQDGKPVDQKTFKTEKGEYDQVKLITAFNDEVAAKISEALANFTGTAVAKLEHLRAMLLDEWRKHRNLMRQLVAEFAAQPASMAAFPEVNQGLVELVADVIREGQKSREFDTRLDPRIVGLSLVSAWNAIAIGWAKSGDTERATEANRQALDLVLRGVLRTPEAA